MTSSPQQRSALLHYLNRLNAEGDDNQSPASETPVLQEVINKIGSAQSLTEQDTSALEKIINVHRPIISIESGTLRVDEKAQPDDGLQSHLLSNAERLGSIAASVGGLTFTGFTSIGWAGSCFVVGEGLVATARHVVEMFASRDTAGRIGLKPGVSASVFFGPDNLSCQVTDVALLHPVLDFALLRLSGTPDCKPLTLDGAPSLTPDRIVCVVGFLTSNAVATLFGSRPSSKQIAAGKIVGLTHFEMFGTPVLAIQHDCSTGAGMSGAPLIDVETGHVLGVHFASNYGVQNAAIPVCELSRDERIRAHGLVFTKESVEPDPLAWNEEWHAATGGDTPSQTPPVDKTSQIASVEEIDRLLAAKFASQEDLINFLTGLGPSYSEAVAAQPGRDRSAPDDYRRALVIALQRRGLIDDTFLHRIGFIREAEAGKPAEESDGNDPWVSPEEVKSICDRLGLETIKGLTLQSIVLGSPFWNKLSQDDEIRPLPDSLAALAVDPRPEARDALIWLLKRLLNANWADAELTKSAEQEIGRVLTRLGEPMPAPIAPYVPEPGDIVDLSYLRSGIEAARAVGIVRVGSSGGGSSWLIAPDLVVTAAHLCNFAPTQGQGPVGARLLASNIDPGVFTIIFEDEEATATRIEVVEIAFIDVGLDIMLLRTKKPVRGRQPLQIRVDTMSAGGITSIHHPNLGPKRMSAQGGRMLANDGHEAIYLLATAVGTAGAPVFDRDWKVVATHRARMKYKISPEGPMIDAKIGTSAPAMIEAIQKAPGSARFWRQIIGAQRALRSIDADLTQAQGWSDDPRQSRSIVIKLVYDKSPLKKIAGLKIVARTGRVISALATRAAVRRLAETAGVISVEASRAGGTIECARSLPYIGVPTVHGKFGETGDKALIALIDNGIDILHEAFLDQAGKSRIVAFWDQQDPRSAVQQPTAAMSAHGAKMVQTYNLRGGALYVREDIESIMAGAALPDTFPPANYMTHGTIVSSIAAGRTTGNALNHFPGGVAPDARLVAVRYDLDGASVGNSGGHVQALDFIDRLATDLNLPVVVNISNGMNSGAHDGSSLVEIACGGFTGQGHKSGRAIVKSAGNELNKARHATMMVKVGFRKVLRWRSTPVPGAFNQESLIERIELWFQRVNSYRFNIRTPQGQISAPIDLKFDRLNESLPNGNWISARYWPMRGENALAMLELSVSKGNKNAVEDGDWALIAEPQKIGLEHPINAWIETISNRDIRFLDNPDNNCTITIPGTSEHVITVGAVDADVNPFPYENSSMGPTASNLAKPDLVAPGVKIFGAAAGTTKQITAGPNDGTSLSAPHVAGVLALAMSARNKKAGAPMFHAITLRAGLLDTLKNFTPHPDPQTGHGSLDAGEFFEYMNRLP